MSPSSECNARQKKSAHRTKRWALTIRFLGTCRQLKLALQLAFLYAFIIAQADYGYNVWSYAMWQIVKS